MNLTPSNVVESIDVSTHAKRMHFALPVRMEMEAIGVLVTRRPMAREDNLTPYESARLLDVIAHASEFCGHCDDEPKQFNVWVVQSDSRDGKARNIWLQLEILSGSYLIRMTDE
jgi:hypothetical protein